MMSLVSLNFNNWYLRLLSCNTYLIRLYDRIAPILQMEKARPRKLSNLPKVTLVSAEPGLEDTQLQNLYFYVGFFRGILPLTPLNTLDSFM